MVAEDYPRVEVTSRAGWRNWLRENHDSGQGAWVVTYKKAAGDRYVAYEDIVEEAICFGWIDSLRRTVDARRSRLLVVPRKAGSNWSRVNKLRVERLEAAGLLTAPGVAAIERAKADGSWTGLDAVEELHEPDDLRAALDARPAARRNWDAFPRSTKRAILEWIGTAKRPETRAKRVAQTAADAAKNIRANQWRQPASR